MGKHFNYKIISGYVFGNIIWVRIPKMGYGLCFKKGPLIFSERMGLTKYLKLWRDWRVILLRSNS